MADTQVLLTNPEFRKTADVGFKYIAIMLAVFFVFIIIIAIIIAAFKGGKKTTKANKPPKTATPKTGKC